MQNYFVKSIHTKLTHKATQLNMTILRAFILLFIFELLPSTSLNLAPSSLLETAIRSAYVAGNLMTSATASDKGVEVTKLNKKDLLTKIDPLCEEAIKKTILARFPDHLILGEESVEPGPSASSMALSSFLEKSRATKKPLWIIDPIDGTTNFVHDLRYSAPSVACCVNGEVVVGCVFDPYANETFWAVKNEVREKRELTQLLSSCF